jgi:uncharacterized membrane protein
MVALPNAITLRSMHHLLHRLAAQFSLPAEATAKLWQLSQLHQPPSALGKQSERGLGAVAALLLGAGLIFWVAANWQEQSRQFKFYAIQAVLLASILGALAWPRGRKGLLLLATMALGGLLAFIGQTYQTGADPWQLFAVWGALALAWMVAARSDMLWAVWVLIVGLGIALWSGNQLFNPLGGLGWHRQFGSYLTPLFWALLVLVTAFVSRTMLTPEPDQVPGRYAFRLAVLLALGAWCTYGIWGLFEERGASYWINAIFVIGAAAIAWTSKPRDITVLAMTVLALDLLFLAGVSKVLFSGGGDKLGTLFFFGLIAMATVGLSGHWIYQLQREEAKV